MVFLNNVTILRENGRTFAAMCTYKIKQNPFTFILHYGIFSVYNTCLIINERLFKSPAVKIPAIRLARRLVMDKIKVSRSRKTSPEIRDMCNRI